MIVERSTASPPLGLFSKKPKESDHLFNAVDIVGHFFDVETQRILIHAAVVARVKDDIEEEITLKMRNFETTCGELIEDLSKPTNVVPLNLREACNKILHASKFHYDTEEEPYEIVNPIVHLYGHRGAKEWSRMICLRGNTLLITAVARVHTRTRCKHPRAVEVSHLLLYHPHSQVLSAK